MQKAFGGLKKPQKSQQRVGSNFMHILYAVHQSYHDFNYFVNKDDRNLEPCIDTIKLQKHRADVFQGWLTHSGVYIWQDV